MTDADGEQQETQHWIGVAYDCEYWDRTIATGLRAKCQEIGRLLGGMLEKSDQFCNNASLTAREAPVEYLVSPPPNSDDEN